MGNRLVNPAESSDAAPWLLNVNIPNMPLEALKPLKLCRLGRRHAAERVIVQDSPRGEKMYWIGGAGAAKDDAEGTDFHATAQGHVSMTPESGSDRSRQPWLLGADCRAHAGLCRGRGRSLMQRRPGFRPSCQGLRRLRRQRPLKDLQPWAPDPSPPWPWAWGWIRRPFGREWSKAGSWGVTSPQVLQAMGQVERHRFVDSALGNQAYEDTSLPIGMGQTISKPSIVARMCELLLGAEVARTAGLGRVLEIGTGCGYQAAVLSLLAREVYTLERVRSLHEKARDNLRPFRLANVHLMFGDGMLGYPSGALYPPSSLQPGILCPRHWCDQLAVGGRLVAPMAVAGGQQMLLVIDKSAHGLKQNVLEPVHFVP